jgi:excinuclease ABC subunit C
MLERQRLASVPPKPGVYVFRDSRGRPLYVGKAKDLRARLRSYLTGPLDERKAAMLRQVEDFSILLTETELEALALEANLIKQYRPRFNVVLRDDKNYPYLKLTLKEPWPRLEVSRRIVHDGSAYFGPFVPASAVWETLRFIRRHMGIRPCRYSLQKPRRPCIQHQIGRCPAPCAGLVSRKEYMKAVQEVRLFLQGDKEALMKALEQRMQRLSEELRYEEAAQVRDRLRALRKAWEHQRVVAPELRGDIDVVGWAREGADCAFQVLFVRQGLLVGAREFFLRGVAQVPQAELMADFLKTFYAKEIIPPQELLLPLRPQDAQTIAQWLSERRKARVRLAVPRRGKRAELLRMAQDNALEHLRAQRAAPAEGVLRELAQRLGLKEPPRSIGAFDVATTAGAHSVGAFVWWQEGQFRKELYRHLRIKTVQGLDDYAMMRESILRVLKDIEPPELLVIDGGRGHLEAALEALRQLGLELSVAAVAKAPDRVFLPRRPAISIEDGRASSLLLKRLRDEAHRFAQRLHKKLRARAMVRSPLQEVAGIGPKRRLALLRRFGSLEAIRQAPVEEIARTEGMNLALARRLKEALLGETVIK